MPGDEPSAGAFPDRDICSLSGGLVAGSAPPTGSTPCNPVSWYGGEFAIPGDEPSVGVFPDRDIRSLSGGLVAGSAPSQVQRLATQYPDTGGKFAGGVQIHAGYNEGLLGYMIRSTTTIHDDEPSDGAIRIETSAHRAVV